MTSKVRKRLNSWWKHGDALRRNYGIMERWNYGDAERWRKKIDGKIITMRWCGLWKLIVGTCRNMKWQKGVSIRGWSITEKWWMRGRWGLRGWRRLGGWWRWWRSINGRINICRIITLSLNNSKSCYNFGVGVIAVFLWYQSYRNEMYILVEETVKNKKACLTIEAGLLLFLQYLLCFVSDITF